MGHLMELIQYILLKTLYELIVDILWHTANFQEFYLLQLSHKKQLEFSTLNPIEFIACRKLTLKCVFFLLFSPSLYPTPYYDV